MNDDPAVSLFDPHDLKLTIANEEEDEEELEDQRRRNKELEEQIATAFTSSSEDEDENNQSNHIVDHSEDHGSPQDTNHLMVNGANGMMFLQNLSSISERSHSGYHSDTSKHSESGHSLSSRRQLFSPPRSAPYKFVRTDSGNREYLGVMGGRGDADSYHPNYGNKMDTNKSFQQSCLSDVSREKSEYSNNSVEGTDPGGRGDADQHFKQILGTNTSMENDVQFKPLFTNVQPLENINYTNGSADKYRQAEFNSMEQLRVLYEVRMKELEHLNLLLTSEREASRKFQSDMERRLALMEAEKERALLSRDEATKLLVAGKEKIATLEKELQTLKQTLADIEKDKAKSEELLEVNKVQVQTLEQRIALMERCNSNMTFKKQTDIMVKELKDKHQQEIYLLQKQVETLTKKLSTKEQECKSSEKKVAELQREQDVRLVEKSDTINQLARSLEESQEQCRQLMAANLAVENVKLGNQLESALKEREHLNQTVRSLQTECAMIKSDLRQYESVSKLTLPQSNSSGDETDSILQMGMSSRGELSKRDTNQSDITSRLKQELHRALLSQKAKRVEIDRLKEVVNCKENELQEMANRERVNIAQMETLNDHLKKMMADLSELQRVRNSNDEPKDRSEEISTLNAEIAEVRKQKAVLEREKLQLQQRFDDLMKRFEEEKKREVSDHNREYLKFHDDTVAKVKKEVEEEAELRLKEYGIRLEQSVQEVQQVKEMYVSVCAAKEQVITQLNQATAELHQVTSERDQLTAELKEVKAVRDQLARRLNNQSAEGERNYRLKEGLDKSSDERDQLAHKVEELNRERNELTLEIQQLRIELLNSVSAKSENQMEVECVRLREELSAMSARHTQELSVARAELQGARDRVVQLEKQARMQFETEVKKLQQDRDMLKAKCDEKEVQIKKLIESRKRPPPSASSATQTDTFVEEGVEAERHRRELARCREEYNKALESMEKMHQEALVAAVSKSKAESDRLLEDHQVLLNRLTHQHREELSAVEERTKQLTVQYFAEEFRRLEAKYMEEANLRPDPALVQTLHNTLIEKTREIEGLRQKLAAVSEEWQKRVAALQSQIEADKESATHVMVQWAQEVKNIQGELKLKEAIIDDQRSNIEKAKAIAKRYRAKLIKTNTEIKTSYMNKCEEYKTEMQKNIEEAEQQVFEKVRQIEQVYEKREKELIKIMKKIQRVKC